MPDIKLWLLEHDNGQEYEDHRREIVRVFSHSVIAKVYVMRHLTGKTWQEMNDQERKAYYVITPFSADKEIDWNLGYVIDCLGQVKSKEQGDWNASNS